MLGVFTDSFNNETNFSSDQVAGLRHSQSDKKLIKSSHSSLFTRLRKGQIGASRTKVGPPGDHRLSLGIGDHVVSVPGQPDTPGDMSTSGNNTANVSQQGSQSCPSSPSIGRRYVYYKHFI